MTPWMKRSEWATVKTATEDLVESIERYAFELSGKKAAVARRNDTRIDCASDDIAFSALNVIVQYPVFLGPLIEALKDKECYDPVFVRDYAPIDRRERYSYIRQLEKGLPVKSIMVTKAFGSNIGNYHYVWKIPQHVTIENILCENQRVLQQIISQLPKYHTRCMKKEFLSKFGRFSPTTKPYILRDIYKELTGMCWVCFI